MIYRCDDFINQAIRSLYCIDRADDRGSLFHYDWFLTYPKTVCGITCGGCPLKKTSIRYYRDHTDSEPSVGERFKKGFAMSKTKWTPFKFFAAVKKIRSH